MTPIIPYLSPLFDFLLLRNISGTDFGTGYGGTVCGFHGIYLGPLNLHLFTLSLVAAAIIWTPLYCNCSKRNDLVLQCRSTNM